MDDYNKKAIVLKRYAAKRGSSREISEDFASYCIELFISGKRNIKTSYKYLYADFIRKEVRQLRTPDPDEVRTTQELVRIPEGLTTQERVALVLYCSWGFNHKEIGHCLGVTESRISKLFKTLGHSFEQKSL